MDETTKDNTDNLIQKASKSIQQTEFLLHGPCVYYSFKSSGLNRHAYIYPSTLTEEQQEKLKQAEAILLELADEVEEEVKTKTTRKQL